MILLLGLGLGGGLSWLSLQDRLGFGALRVGAWTAWPLAGSAAADPYTKAKVAADGEIPLGAAEGLVFLARADEDGRPLRRECQYQVEGRTPPARLWTLSAHTLDGRALTRRPGTRALIEPVVSRGLLRNTDGSVAITVGARRSANNWLRLSGSGPFQLVLRLYDAQLTATAETGETPMPRVRFAGCPT